MQIEEYIGVITGSRRPHHGMSPAVSLQSRPWGAASMLSNVDKKVEFAANVAIIVVACLLATVLIKTYFVPKRPESASKSESPSVNIPTLSGLNIDWRQNKQTLLLAVSSTCHFCTESAPFYQQLAKQHGQTRLIALLPQPIVEGRQYLDGLGVTVDEIKQAPLSSININGTPTLMLVDGDGVVVKTWIGKLQDEQQQEVLKRVL
jgi:hypothetical protein